MKSGKCISHIYILFSSTTIYAWKRTRQVSFFNLQWYHAQTRQENRKGTVRVVVNSDLVESLEAVWSTT
jgi:hypothetical protein